MKPSEITSAKERLESLKAEVAQLEREIRRTELNAEMNRIEGLKMKNFGLINGLRETIGEGDPSVQNVITTLQKQNAILEEEWQKVYKEYFYL